MATRVALITPPLDASGGIGRLMSYVAAASESDEVTIRLLDTRGRSVHPVLSIFPLLRAWLALLWLGLTRRVDVAHINVSSHGSSVRKPVMLWTCRLLRIPAILHLHASEYQEFFAGLPSPAKLLLRRTFAAADAVLVLGRSYREYVCGELAVPAEKVTVLLNGSPGPDAAPKLHARGSGPLRILFLGRLGNRKGVPELLRALADSRVRAAAWSATLAGDGEIEQYRSQVAALGLEERVSFPGWVDADRTRRLLLESHLLVLPSRAEGLPMSVIEAFAYAVPVVSTSVGAIADIVEHDVNGIIVPAGDSIALADAILTLLNDEPLRLRLARSARRTWEERLNISSYAQDLTSCWQLAATNALGEPASA
jgi:glycosyltransferase involved in cell wall biosynthesis